MVSKNLELKNLKADYKHIDSLDRAAAIICDNMTNVATSFMRIGFALQQIKENELYLEAGFSDVWQYAYSIHHISRSTASRFIQICEQFSVGGCSYVIQSQYKDYSSSQLIEMLSLNDEQRKQVKPSDTVKQIREKKNLCDVAHDKLRDDLLKQLYFSCFSPFESLEWLEALFNRNCKTHYGHCGDYSFLFHGGKVFLSYDFISAGGNDAPYNFTLKQLIKAFLELGLIFLDDDDDVVVDVPDVEELQTQLEVLTKVNENLECSNSNLTHSCRLALHSLDEFYDWVVRFVPDLDKQEEFYYFTHAKDLLRNI